MKNEIKTFGNNIIKMNKEMGVDTTSPMFKMMLVDNIIHYFELEPNRRSIKMVKNFLSL